MTNNKSSRYHKSKIKDIKAIRMNIPWDKITCNGYDKGVNNRPIRDGHVSRMVASPEDESFKHPIVVIYDDKTDTYPIVDGQHQYLNISELVEDGLRKKPESYECEVVHRRSTGEMMLAKNKNDALIALKHGYSRNSGSDLPAFCDILNLLYIEGQYILSEMSAQSSPSQQQLKAMYAELSKTEFGYRKFSHKTIRTYYNYGIVLTEAGFMKDAQQFKWTQKEVDEFKRTGNKPERESKNLEGESEEKSEFRTVCFDIPIKYAQLAENNKEEGVKGIIERYEVLLKFEKLYPNV
jgi:hypothetical protein